MCEFFSEALASLNSYFGSSIYELKDQQVKAVEALCSGKDCICSLPTGFGKTVIYEILPFVDKGCLVIVVVPLTAIIDQQLQRLGHMANRILNIEKSANVSFLYAHPEDIVNSERVYSFLSTMSRNVYLVIDEAHCILEWGEDFRPNFTKIGQIRSVVSCTVLALSATITMEGKKKISSCLLMKDFVDISHSPAKDNISLIVLNRPSPNARGNLAETPYTFIFQPVIEELNRDPNNFPITIIYCKNLQWIGFGYQLARRILGDNFYEGEEIETARVVMFHSSMEKSSGKLKAAILSSLQKPVSDCPIRLIFSTVALGMGADLKHVQRVIHAGPPTSLETYVQEIGRAGRTDSSAEAICYYNKSDLAPKTMRKDIKAYCTNENKCRREMINAFFGFDATVKPDNCCNVCNRNIDLEWKFDNLNLK